MWEIILEKNYFNAFILLFNHILIYKMYILGIIDKLMKEIENRVFLSKKSGLKFMDSFLKKVIIS